MEESRSHSSTRREAHADTEAAGVADTVAALPEHLELHWPFFRQLWLSNRAGAQHREHHTEQ